jgi:hypothetical protein
MHGIVVEGRAEEARGSGCVSSRACSAARGREWRVFSFDERGLQNGDVGKLGGWRAGEPQIACDGALSSFAQQCSE